MKIYEGYSQSPDGWNVSSTLTLEEGGRFSYSEGRTDYTNASLSSGASGTWKRGHRIIIFHTEETYGWLYFPWGGETVAKVLDDDTLDFGQELTLSPPGPAWEYMINTPVSNTGTEPLTLVLDPWGIRHPLAPGESVLIVAKGRWSEGGKPVAVHEENNEVVFYARNGSWATIVPQSPSTPPKPPKPPATPPADIPKVTEPVATKPSVKSSVAPSQSEPEAASTPAPPFKPLVPSGHLSWLLRKWIGEIETGDLGNWVRRLCREHDAYPLDGNQFEIWALRPDGQVLCIDHESAALRVELETNAEIAYNVIAVGARTRPELLELLPPDLRRKYGRKR